MGRDHDSRLLRVGCVVVDGGGLIFLYRLECIVKHLRPLVYKREKRDRGSLEDDQGTGLTP